VEPDRILVINEKETAPESKGVAKGV